jgi:hypothetical protein
LARYTVLAPVAARPDAARAIVGAPFVHEMFYSAGHAKPRDATLAQVGDELRVAHRVAPEDALRDRRFDEEGLDPLQQRLCHKSSLIAPAAGRLAR